MDKLNRFLDEVMSDDRSLICRYLVEMPDDDRRCRWFGNGGAKLCNRDFCPVLRGIKCEK